MHLLYDAQSHRHISCKTHASVILGFMLSSSGMPTFEHRFRRCEMHALVHVLYNGGIVLQNAKLLVAAKML